MRWWLLTLVWALGMIGAACSSEDPPSTEDDPAEVPRPNDDDGPAASETRDAGIDAGPTPCGGRARPLDGLSAEGTSELSLELVDFSSDPPIAGDNSWLVKLELAGEPLLDAEEGIVVAPTMPDHGHGTSVAVGVTEVAPGSYRFEPVNTFMVGYWQIDVSVEIEDVMGSVQFGVCVE